MYKILKNIIEMDDYSVQKLSKSQPPEPFEWNSVEGTELNVSDCIGGKGKIAVKGNTYQKSRVLPEGYTQVDYIESHGEEYIDTGVNADSNLRTVLDMQYTNISVSNNTNIGAIYSESGVYVRYHIIARDTNIAIYLNRSTPLIDSDTNRHNFDIDAVNNIAIVDGQEIALQNSYQIDTQLNFWLFGRNSNVSTLIFKSSLKLYSSKMYVSGVLVRDFVPCYRNSDNEVGLYDLVNNVFYTNDGTGAFTYGSVVDIPNPEYPQEIKVVTGNNVVKHVGKNLFNFQENIDTSSGLESIINETNLKITGTATSTQKMITGYIQNSFKEGNYVFSIDKTITNRLILRFFDENNNVLNSYVVGNTVTSVPFILSGAEKKYRLIFNPAVNTTYNIDVNLQLEEGSTPTPFEQYKEKNYNLNLGTIELCKIDNYQDILFKNVVGDENYNAELENGAWYKKKAINKKVFDGIENWTRYYNASRGGGFYLTLSDSINGSSCLCDKFVNDNVHAAWFGVAGSFRITDTLNAAFKTTGAGTDPGTLEDWKSKLSSDNLILYYPLDTPTTTKITDTTLISQLEALNKARWFKGVNHWWTETDNLEPVLKGTYRQAINE